MNRDSRRESGIVDVAHYLVQAEARFLKCVQKLRIGMIFLHGNCQEREGHATDDQQNRRGKRRGDGFADLSYVHDAAGEIAADIEGFTVVALKSTVPVGTNDDVEAIIRKLRAFVWVAYGLGAIAVIAFKDRHRDFGF